MLEDVVERLKRGKLLEDDYPALVEALSQGQVIASGIGAMAVGGNVVNSLTTFVLQFGSDAKVELPEAILTKLNEAVRRSLPPILHNLPPIAPAFTGRVREGEEIVGILTGQGGGLAAISALIAFG